MEKTRVDLRSCSICLDLLKDPVTLPCGHNYCKICLEVLWQDKIFYECPQCRQRFRERPVLQKNTVLAELVEELKMTGPAQDLCSAGPGGVASDVCTGKEMKAIKSCLVHPVSYCDLHLQPHLEAPAYRRNKLVQPSNHLQEITSPQHEEKKMFLTHSKDITLDPNTADVCLMLSEGNKKVTFMGTRWSRPRHRSDRFTCYQVLSQESLTGRCYFEVKTIEQEDCVAVSYKNISRSGRESLFGQNDKSWCLCFNFFGCSFIHNKITTKISSVRPSTVGVYLDHSAGLLSFYSVSETMTLLHRVQTSFSRPLHAGVCVSSSCEFVKLK